jgi:hypothetical protein
MKNRAKCKLCKNIIESFHKYDYVTCGCGEISILGGQDSYECFAKDFSNFLRVDDEGNEIIVKVKEKNEEKIVEEPLSRDKILDIMKEMIKDYEKLPPQAMQVPITHYDHYSLLLLLSQLLK